MDIAAPDPVFNEPAPAAAPEPDAEPSLADHEAQFSPEARAKAATDEPPADGTEPAAEGRDDKGRFKPAKVRHRAASQQASTADVPRIAELTRKLREAEAKIAAGTTTPPAAPAAAAPAPQRPPTPAEPTAMPRLKQFVDKLKDDEPYELAIEQHAEALADWKLDQHNTKQAAQAAEREFLGGFRSRIETAKAKYPDFQAVALDAPSRIPQGSLIDRWIFEHKVGPDVLYHFQKDDADLTRVLALPVIEQVEALALLGQRFSTPSQAQAVNTGSAAPRPAVTPAPRPPNPVRTGPLNTGDEPPSDDMTLADHEKRYGKPRR